jgi:hypothetical protein
VAITGAVAVIAAARPPGGHERVGHQAAGGPRRGRGWLHPAGSTTS